MSGTILHSPLTSFVRRYLQRAVVQHPSTFPHADHLADALHDVFATLPLVVRALHHRSRASGLLLNPSNCFVLPLRTGGMTMTDLYALLCLSFAARTSARYLGVDLGATAAATKLQAL